METKGIEKKRDPDFDADYSPGNPHNREVARRLGLRYDEGRRVYVDRDGCLIKDRFGQELG